MLRRLLGHARQNVVAYLALFVALGGTSAYAADTVFSTDIVDNQVFPADVRDDNLSGGGLGPADLAPGSVTSSEVRDDTQGFGWLTASDLRSGSVTSSEISPFSINEGDIASHVIESRHINPGTLKDEDVSQGTFVNFAANIGTVPAQGCVKKQITGINAAGDHLLLTPNNDDARGSLIYSVLYTSNQEWAWLETCNPGTVALNDDVTHFNLMIFNAQ